MGKKRGARSKIIVYGTHEEEVNNDFIVKYQEYMIHFKLAANYSIRNMRYTCRMFSSFILGRGGKTLDKATVEDIEEFFKWRIQQQKAYETLKLDYIFLRGMYKWMLERKSIDQYPIPNLKLQFRKKTEGKYLAAALTAKQIFKLRFKPVDLHKAMIIEVLLSTGIRAGELQQLRACDIVWGKAPYDYELGEKSKFISATIPLRTKFHRIKRDRERDVYLNLVAGRLVLKYMEYFNIKGRVPVFPFATSLLGEWMRKTLSDIYDPATHPAIMQDDEQQEDRLIHYEDLTLEDMEALPCDFHSFIVSMKKSLDKLQADNGSLNILEPEKRIKEAMHPHALRHTFCNIMWYRTYTGKRNDLRELMLTMGHGKFEITQGYLDRYCAVNTDAEWFKLMQGNPLIDYKHAMSQDSFALKKVIHSPSKTFLRRRDAEI